MVLTLSLSMSKKLELPCLTAGDTPSVRLRLLQGRPMSHLQKLHKISIRDTLSSQEIAEKIGVAADSLPTLGISENQISVQQLRDVLCDNIPAGLRLRHGEEITPRRAAEAIIWRIGEEGEVIQPVDDGSILAQKGLTARDKAFLLTRIWRAGSYDRSIAVLHHHQPIVIGERMGKVLKRYKTDHGQKIDLAAEIVYNLIGQGFTAHQAMLSLGVAAREMGRSKVAVAVEAIKRVNFSPYTEKSIIHHIVRALEGLLFTNEYFSYETPGTIRQPGREGGERFLAFNNQTTINHLVDAILRLGNGDPNRTRQIGEELVRDFGVRVYPFVDGRYSDDYPPSRHPNDYSEKLQQSWIKRSMMQLEKKLKLLISHKVNP